MNDPLIVRPEHTAHLENNFTHYDFQTAYITLNQRDESVKEIKAWCMVEIKATSGP